VFATPGRHTFLIPINRGLAVIDSTFFLSLSLSLHYKFSLSHLYSLYLLFVCATERHNGHIIVAPFRRVGVRVWVLHGAMYCTSIDQTSTRFDPLLSDVCLLLLACYLLVPPVLLWAAAAETLLFALRSLLREGRGGCLPLVALQPSWCWSSLLHCQLEKPFVTHMEQNTRTHTHVHAQRMKEPTDRVVFHAAHISSASSSASAVRSYL